MDFQRVPTRGSGAQARDQALRAMTWTARHPQAGGTGAPASVQKAVLRRLVNRLGAGFHRELAVDALGMKLDRVDR